MSDRLPGSSYYNPIWHRGWRIWSCFDVFERQAFAYAHEDADLEDDTDRRHGEAQTIHQARAEIDAYLNDQDEIDLQRAGEGRGLG